MPPKGRGSTKAKKSQDQKDARAYDHHKKGEEKLLLRPDIGLQAQFKQKKPPKSYRYDPSLDPALSWDVSADRERAADPTRAKVTVAELRKCGKPLRLIFGLEDSLSASAPGALRLPNHPDRAPNSEGHNGRAGSPESNQVKAS